MGIHYFKEDVAFPDLKRRIINAWIKKVIDSEGKICGNLSFIFCSDDYLLEINRKYLNHDYLTDVITFDYVNGNVIEGDIFLSIDRIKENSKEYNTTFKSELERILIHGVLHLLGYKDKSKADKDLMTFKEDIYLNVLNI